MKPLFEQLQSAQRVVVIVCLFVDWYIAGYRASFFIINHHTQCMQLHLLVRYVLQQLFFYSFHMVYQSISSFKHRFFFISVKPFCLSAPFLCFDSRIICYLLVFCFCISDCLSCFLNTVPAGYHE